MGGLVGLGAAFVENPKETTYYLFLEPIYTDWQAGNYGEAIGGSLFVAVEIVVGAKGAASGARAATAAIRGSNAAQTVRAAAAGVSQTIRAGRARVRTGFLKGPADEIAGTRGAPSRQPALPDELTLGRNADPGVDVYLGIREGKPVYTGISNQWEIRQAQHGSRFDRLDPLTRGQLTRGEARAVEQALITRNPGFRNIRNSISPLHPYFGQAVEWGEWWLRQNGLG